MSAGNVEKLKGALIANYGMKLRQEWLQQGRCPSCGKKELYCPAENPVTVRCNRINKCGYEAHVKDLFPEFFGNFNKNYAPKPDDPNRTANAYMELVRGINPVKYKSNWKQGSFFHNAGDRPTATVEFPIADGVSMERFVEPVIVTDEDGTKTERKQNFKGKHGGLWWQPTAMPLEEGDSVWIVEGCIDALSLWANGVKAVAVLACRNYPKKLFDQHKGRNITWVWALDPDKAGRTALLKHHRKLLDAGENSDAALVSDGPSKSDWNDLHIKGQLGEDDIRRYRYYGALHIATTATEKAILMWQHYRTRNGFDLVFRNRTYWFELDYEKFRKTCEALEERESFKSKEEMEHKAAQLSGSITEIANCEIDWLYFMANKITDESWYYARVTFPHGGAPVKNTFSGGQLASSTEFKKRLLSIAAGAWFTGSTNNLNQIGKDKLFGIKTVDTVDFVGYSKEFGAYLFNDKAVSDGKVIDVNDEDYFQIDKTSLKSLCSSPTLMIGDIGAYDDGWRKPFWTAFGVRGAVALAFWIGSLFAEQIRARHKSFPFLEIIGEPGSGKSTLIEFLWRLCGRLDYEGFDPSKSTLAARSRNFSQVSNLPVVFIESDREDDTGKVRSFDWDEMKTAYNGRASRSRGIKNAGNDTYEPPFRGALVISQNQPVNASDAIMERIIHVRIDKDGHTEAGKRAGDAIKNYPIETVSQFLIDIVKKEKEILSYFDKHAPKYEAKLYADVGHQRVALNHGQMMALLDIAVKILDISEVEASQCRAYLTNLAHTRLQAIKDDHEIVQNFWELYDYLEAKTDGRSLNHSPDSEREIAINLNEFIALAHHNKQEIPPLRDLKKHLKTSRHRKFMESGKAVRDGDKVLKCWLFEKGTM